MIFKIIFTFLISTCLFKNICPLLAQSQEIISDEGYLYDDQLDYYPHFIGRSGGEFQDEIKIVLNSCGFAVTEMEQISGFSMRIMGIPPKAWHDHIMLGLYIDEKGHFVQISFGGKPIPPTSESCFMEKIKGGFLNPALKDNLPVKCKFSYLLIEQKEKQHK